MVILFGRNSQRKTQKGLEELIGMLLHAEANIKSLGTGKIEINTPVFKAEIPVSVEIDNYVPQFTPLLPASPVYKAGAVLNPDVYFTNFNAREHEQSMRGAKNIMEKQLNEGYKRMERVGAALKVIAEGTDHDDVAKALDEISEERGKPIEYRASPASFYETLVRMNDVFQSLERLNVGYASVLRNDIMGVLEKNEFLRNEQNYQGHISSDTAAYWILAHRTAQQQLTAKQLLQGV